MKTKKKGKTIVIELTEEEACVLVASLGGTRNAEMHELRERIVGSEPWKVKHRPADAFEPLVDLALYNAVVERCD